jgi:hypothetical protein
MVTVDVTEPVRVVPPKTVANAIAKNSDRCRPPADLGTFFVGKNDEGHSVALEAWGVMGFPSRALAVYSGKHRMPGATK